MAEIDNLSKNLDAFNNDLDDLDNYLQKLMTLNNVDEVEEKISPIEFAELNAAVAYSINSVYYMYMKVNGIEKEDHKINVELSRVKKYISKIQKAKNVNK